MRRPLNSSPSNSARLGAPRRPKISSIICVPVSSPYKWRLRAYHQPANNNQTTASVNRKRNRPRLSRWRQPLQNAVSSKGGANSKPESLVMLTRASSKASVRLRRGWKPWRNNCSVCQISKLPSAVTNVSLLTEAEMKRNCGLKAVRPAASRARPCRSGASKRAVCQTAATVTVPNSRLKRRAQNSASVLPSSSGGYTRACA